MIKDRIYKILFAVQLALIPLVFYTQFCVSAEWAISIVILVGLTIKIMAELFVVDRQNLTHNILLIIDNCLIFSIVTILFMCLGFVNIALGVVVLVFNVIANLFLFFFKDKTMPKFIDSVDFGYTLLLCYAYFALAFVKFYPNLTLIALIALLVITLVSVCYKVYYAIKYTNFTTNFKNFFSKFKFKPKSKRK